MSTYVIGIGGTGSKIIESLIHISAVGLIKEGEVINLFLIDADIANGNLNRTLSVKNYYDKTRNVEGAELNRTSINFKKDDRGNDIQKWSVINGDINTLRQVFTSDFNKQNSTAKLLSVLYSKQELDEPLEKGFKGHPNIGSLIITKNLILEQEPWKSLFEGINTEITNHGNVKIIVCGSIFGGTGAAGIPTISKILYERFGDSEKITLNAILMLPYFSFRNSEETGLKAESDKFLENAKYALEYYNNEKYYDYYRKLYIIGDEVLTPCFAASLGGGEQENQAMMPELIAALAIKEIISDEKNRKYVSYCNKSDDLSASIPITVAESNKIIQYLLFSLHYTNVYYPRLKIFVNNREIPRTEPWAVNYFKMRGIDIFDGDTFENLEGIYLYSDAFLRWAKELFSEGRYKGYINASLFKNCSTDIKAMNDLSCILANKRIDKRIRYDKIYKGMNGTRVKSASKTEIGLFFKDLYEMCEM